MTPVPDVDIFRKVMGGLIMRVMTIAQEEGVEPQVICKMLSEQSLMFAADLHEGSDEAFLNLARLALMHTGSIEQ